MLPLSFCLVVHANFVWAWLFLTSHPLLYFLNPISPPSTPFLSLQLLLLPLQQSTPCPSQMRSDLNSPSQVLVMLFHSFLELLLPLLSLHLQDFKP
ncbi:hypothetical protein VNO78_23464 [Psophocarpus tetragonolobus]|uniref:Uncharacterized protein n=1 Tax=Psophocarpus tetragonolobus TaxID=3891 RepID=A0AAN9S466_PSOTE